jgi:DNA-binding response OmpR family regulator
MSQPIKVLLVDDNEDVLDAFEEGLTNYGFQVLLAEDGAQGLERCVQFLPDCIVIDLRMPELDGHQLARAVRGDPATATTPIIMLTALPQDRERFRGMASGVDLYLLKPQTPTEIAAVIRHVVQIDPAERVRRWQRLAEEE